MRGGREAVAADGERIKLPVIGWVKMREAVRFSGLLKRVTVSREADRWFASVMVETDDVKPVERPYARVGVDLGVSTQATLSTGEKITGPKAHKTTLKRLRRANKALARKRRGSANFRKAKHCLAEFRNGRYPRAYPAPHNLHLISRLRGGSH